MTMTALVLIALGAVLLLGALGDVLFQRTGVPDLLFLMLAGLLLGPGLGLVQRSDLDAIAPHVASVALVFGALEAGGKLKLAAAPRPWGRAALLAGIAFAGTVALVVPVAMIASAAGLLVTSFGLGDALILGASLGCSAATLSIPAMGRGRLDVATQGLLEGEYAIGSALGLVTVAIALDVMTASGDGVGAVLVSVLQSVAIGLAIGLVAGVGWSLFLRAVRSSEHAFALTFAALLIVFATARITRADALLAVLAFSLATSHADAVAQRLGMAPSPIHATDGSPLRHGLALVVRSSLFLVAGILLAPPWIGIGLGLSIVVLAAGARVPAVLAATRGPGARVSSRPLLAIAMPRGAFALALALVPLSTGVAAAHQLASIAAAAVLLTNAAFVAAVLVLQKLAPATLAPAADVPEPTSRSVSLIDSTARPAAELVPSIVIAPARSDPSTESGTGPLSTRTPLPLPVPVAPPLRPVPPPIRTAARETRTTLSSEPDLEELDVQEAPPTPRRYPAPPTPPSRGSQGGRS